MSNLIHTKISDIDVLFTEDEWNHLSQLLLPQRTQFAQVELECEDISVGFISPTVLKALFEDFNAHRKRGVVNAHGYTNKTHIGVKPESNR